MTTPSLRLTGAAGIVTALMFAGLIDSLAPFAPFVGDAQAKVGRPLTPRTIRRSTIYVARLPAACVKTSINGTVLWHCGSTYYQPYGGRYVVVHVY